MIVNDTTFEFSFSTSLLLCIITVAMWLSIFAMQHSTFNIQLQDRKTDILINNTLKNLVRTHVANHAHHPAENTTINYI